MTISVASLTFYPIKSCRGFDVSAAWVERAGLAGDRRMMVTTPDGDLLTQREHDRLAWVTPALADGTVTLSAPEFEAIRIPVLTRGPTVSVRVWKSTGIQAVDQGDEAAAWFSDWLRAAVRLVHLADDYRRRVDPQYAVSTDDHTGFADAYPILLAAQASLAELNSRLDSPLPMDRFRPNLVLRGGEPFAEDGWRRIRIGELELAVVKPCARCVVTTIDKQTLAHGREPLKTLATFRKRDGKVMFGQNAIPLNEGRIEAGAPVEVLS
jgi:uncharacterized protein YcbX